MTRPKGMDNSGLMLRHVLPRHGHRDRFANVEELSEDSGSPGWISIEGDTISSIRAGSSGSGCLFSEQFLDRLDEPRNIEMYRVPENAMIDQVIAVEEVVSRARDFFPGNIITTLLEFVWQSPNAFPDDLDASLQPGRCLPIRQEGLKRVGGTQPTGLIGSIEDLRERDSRVTTAHECS
jgi:hypothetical protein